MKDQHKAWKCMDFRPAGLESLWTGDRARPRERVVYLTADSPNTLDTLEDDTAYVIGALVDHNRYKVRRCTFHLRSCRQNRCFEVADALGLPHAALPIGAFVAEMPSRKVLTVNQVADIMLRWLETRDWAAAFDAAIPKRKFKQRKRGGASAAADDEVSLADDADERSTAAENDVQLHGF